MPGLYGGNECSGEFTEESREVVSDFSEGGVASLDSDMNMELEEGEGLNIDLEAIETEEGQDDAFEEIININQTEIPQIQYERQWEETSNRTFITNGKPEVVNGKEILKDEEITYATAVNRTTHMASNLLNEIEQQQNICFLEQDKREMKDRIEDVLKKQQAYTDGRGLGDHGIKHIYGNIERSDYALRQHEVSASARLAVLIAQVYHDEGYTTDEIHKKIESDKNHDKASQLLFEHNQKEFFQRFFMTEGGEPDQVRMNAILDAIGEHNEDMPDKVKENINPYYDNADGNERENHLIVTAVHLSDKCALSENEKLAELYENENMVSLLTRIYETGEKALEYKTNMQKEFENIPADDTITREAYEHAIDTMEETEKNLKEQMKSNIEKSDYSQELKSSFCKAIDKDVSLASAKFTVPMNDIALSSQALELVEDGGDIKAKITIHVFDHHEASELIGKELAQKQVEKAFGDMGVEKAKAAQMALAALRGETQELKGQNVIIQVKKISIDQIENNEKRKAIRRETNEGATLAKETFAKEIHQEKKITCDKIADKLKHNPESITKHDIHKLIRLNKQGSWEVRSGNIKRWKRLLETCDRDESKIKSVAEIVIAQTYSDLTNALIQNRGKE